MWKGPGGRLTLADVLPLVWQTRGRKITPGNQRVSPGVSFLCCDTYCLSLSNSTMGSLNPRPRVDVPLFDILHYIIKSYFFPDSNLMPAWQQRSGHLSRWPRGPSHSRHQRAYRHRQRNKQSGLEMIAVSWLCHGFHDKNRSIMNSQNSSVPTPRPA